MTTIADPRSATTSHASWSTNDQTTKPRSCPPSGRADGQKWPMVIWVVVKKRETYSANMSEAISNSWRRCGDCKRCPRNELKEREKHKPQSEDGVPRPLKGHPLPSLQLRPSSPAKRQPLVKQPPQSSFLKRTKPWSTGSHH